jgi:hypothetical protein
VGTIAPKHQGTRRGRADQKQDESTGSTSRPCLSSFLVHNAVLGWLCGRPTAVGKSETELAIDVQLASRSASRRFERADE